MWITTVHPLAELLTGVPELKVELQDGDRINLVCPDCPEVAHSAGTPDYRGLSVLLQDATQLRAVHFRTYPYPQVLTLPRNLHEWLHEGH